MLSLKNISTTTPVIITANPRDDPKPISPPGEGKGLHIAPGETRKVPQPTCGGSCLTSVWSKDLKLVWQGVIPSTGTKDFEIDPDHSIVKYEGVQIPSAKESRDVEGFEGAQHPQEPDHKRIRYEFWISIFLLLLLLGIAIYWYRSA